MGVQKVIRLNSGFDMPTVGLGVYKSAASETVATVLPALKLGYRHIDTAQFYGNEAEVGQAVRESGLPRDEVFVTSKVWISNWGHQQALASLRDTLSRMGLSYLDLVLLHAPGSPDTRADTWRAMEEAVEQGLVRSIGVSNFGPAHLDKLLTSAKIVPAVNQIEVTPFLQRRELVAYCKAKGIVVQAYSPLCKGSMLQDPRLAALSAPLGISPAQLLLRWSLQTGLVPLPKSSNPERQAVNLDVYGFELGEEVMSRLNELDQGMVTGWDPVANDPV